MHEKELIKEYINGNRHAQQLLYSKYPGIMLGVYYRYTKILLMQKIFCRKGLLKCEAELQSI